MCVCVFRVFLFVNSVLNFNLLNLSFLIAKIILFGFYVVVNVGVALATMII